MVAPMNSPAARQRRAPQVRSADGVRALTLLETLITVVLIALLMSVLLPALSTARSSSYRDHCASNQRKIGQAWEHFLEDHERQFPFVPVQPGWYYGGVRFSAATGDAFPDSNRPLTPYLNLELTRDFDRVCVCCPADRGIRAPDLFLGTGERTAFRTYGTSYRANAPILNAQLGDKAAGLKEPLARGLKRGEITTSPSRLVLCGDAVWYEVAEQTGRNAAWHNEPDAGNLLFLDGSVRFVTLRPRPVAGPVVYDPIVPGVPPIAPALEGERLRELHGD